MKLNIFLKMKSLYYHILNDIYKRSLKRCGKNVHIDEGVRANWDNMSIGSDVYVGRNNLFMCSKAPIIIGNHVMLGPNVTFITGDHRIDIVGRYMTSIKNDEKLAVNDLPIVVAGDNWIGANAIILKGVTIGEGAVIAAGSLVNRDVPDYSIVGGVPAKIIKYRFNEEQVRKHKEMLNI